MRDIFFFDAMLTPKIITLIYWVLLLGALFSGLAVMFTGYNGLFKGLGIIVAGSIGARIWCELLIVLFKIHENIRKIADRTP